MEHNKALWPDRFLVEFYQNFWEVIEMDLVELFNVLHAWMLDFISSKFQRHNFIAKGL
jgi:hypothetical protein